MNRDVRHLIADHIEGAARRGNGRVLHTISAFAQQAQYLADKVFEALDENPDVDIDVLAQDYENAHDYYVKTRRDLCGYTTYGELGVGDCFVLEEDAQKRGATSYRKTDVPGIAHKNDMSGRTIQLTDDACVCATAW